SFNGYETLVPQSLGSESGHTASYVLRELRLACESDPSATPKPLGTWVKSPASRPDPATNGRVEPRPPNTCLQLLTSDRFGRRGSISGAGAEKIGMDYCQTGTSTEKVCVS